jgi:hypothetical protein
LKNATVTMQMRAVHAPVRAHDDLGLEVIDKLSQA